MVTAGAPHYGRPLDMSPNDARRGLTDHLLLRARGRALRRGQSQAARLAGVRRGHGRTPPASRPRDRFDRDRRVPSPDRNLALELAPVRVNLIAAGFIDTPLSARLLGDDLDKRRKELRATLPIGRVVGPADVAALVVHIMSNTALTGATYDIDGGQQLIS